jgi:tetratricopeptide (TPR) repeat protein
VPKVKEIDPKAYALYLQGRYFYNQWTEEGFEKAVDAFKAALKLEPEYAPAWERLGSAYFRQSGLYRDIHETTALARAAAERALALDDRLPEAHASMGYIRMYYDWDWQRADEAMQRALALEPGNVVALQGASDLAAVLGRLDESISLSRRGIELDPLNRFAHIDLGAALVTAGRLEEAAATVRHVLELDPQTTYAHWFLGYVFLLQDQPELALTEMKRETDPPSRELGAVMALSALGRMAEADQALAVFVEEYKESNAFYIALAYAWRGDADQAFVWLDRAYEQRDSLLAEMLLEPALSNLKSDPRWSAFLDKMGLPH